MQSSAAAAAASAALTAPGSTVDLPRSLPTNLYYMAMAQALFTHMLIALAELLLDYEAATHQVNPLQAHL